MEEVKEVKQLTVDDFKLGLRAVRLYEQIFDRANPVEDLVAGRHIWEVIAVCKIGVLTKKDYEEFILTEEYDQLLPIAGDIVEKLFKDQLPKKD